MSKVNSCKGRETNGKRAHRLVPVNFIPDEGNARAKAAAAEVEVAAEGAARAEAEDKAPALAPAL